MRQMSELGLAVLKSFESCRLTAYRDSVGVLTIGYGDTRDVQEGQTITQEEADSRLQERLESEFCPGVEKLLHVELNEDQFSALVDFAYNEGLYKLHGSTLLSKVNAGDMDVSEEFAKWKFAGGKVLKGLALRRRAEAALFSGDLDTVQAILNARS